MPKVKSEKKSLEKAEAEEKKADEKPGFWGKGKLFDASENPESAVQGAGFKDKAKALETLKILDGRDMAYQNQVIGTMSRRAKVIIQRTKDPEKVKNMEEAVAVFEEWLKDYKDNNRSKENYSYLAIEIMEAYNELAEHYGIPQKTDESDQTFLEAYREVDGDHKRLRVKPIKEGGITWDIHRNRFVKKRAEEVKNTFTPVFQTSGPLKDLPTKEHVELIMWGYSPENAKLKKVMPQIKDKLKAAEA